MNYRKELTSNIKFQADIIYVRNDLFEQIIKSCKATNIEFTMLKEKLGICPYEENYYEEEIIKIQDDIEETDEEPIEVIGKVSNEKSTKKLTKALIEESDEEPTEVIGKVSNEKLTKKLAKELIEHSDEYSDKEPIEVIGKVSNEKLAKKLTEKLDEYLDEYSDEELDEMFKELTEIKRPNKI